MKFQLGDTVRKIQGSQWSGKVVGTYSTALTPEGYAVESSTERGSVQIYPAAALEHNWPSLITDADRLMFAMQDIDGFVSVEWDKHDYAIHFAEANGRDEPTLADELEGVRMMIDAALQAAKPKQEAT
jgi:hypothetical protein